MRARNPGSKPSKSGKPVDDAPPSAQPPVEEQDDGDAMEEDKSENPVEEEEEPQRVRIVRLELPSACLVKEATNEIVYSCPDHLRRLPRLNS